jgi:hypothetical protein
MTADVRRALDVLATMTDAEVGSLALLWRFPDHDPMDPIPREQVAAALRFGRIDAAGFPARARGMQKVVRMAEARRLADEAR